MTECRFTEEGLLSLNRNNFKRLFQLRGVPHFPCNKAPAELVDILFAHADWLSKFDYNNDKYTDEELKERKFTEDKLQLFNHDNFEKILRLRGRRDPFPCNKTPAELAEMIFLIQEQETDISYYGKSTDSSSSDDASDVDNISVLKGVSNDTPKILNLLSIKKLKVVELRELLKNKI